MNLHAIPREYVSPPSPPEFFIYEYNKPCSYCNSVITERRWMDHDDCALKTIEAASYEEFWWCECECSHSANPHVYRNSDDSNMEGARNALGVEYACSPCIRGEHPNAYAP